MRVLVLGATGFIGRAVSRHLADAGHEVVALTRSPEATAALERAGHEALAGDLSDVAGTVAVATGFDAVIYTAAPENQPELEPALAEALVRSLPPAVTLIWTTGVRVAQAPSGTVGDESSELVFTGPVGWKAQTEATILSGHPRGMAIRPAFVYAAQGTSIVELLRFARQGGSAVPIPEEGAALWSTVHVDDLADLYVRALEQGAGGRAYVATSEDTITVRELAELVAHADGLDGRTESLTLSELQARLGPMAMLAGLLTSDAVFSGARAQAELGWQPAAPGIRESIGAHRG